MADVHRSALARLISRPPVVVAGIVLLGSGVTAAFTARISGFNPDEIGYTHLAIGIAHSLTPFTRNYGGSQRLNQLYPLLIAPIWGLFGNVSAFRIAHVWNAILMASAAIPTYLLAMDVVQRRRAAYLAALLVALMPWMTLATAELTEVAAFPACAWALLAMQRSLSRPSPRRDVIALVAIAVASYGRLQLIILAPVLVVAMLAHELFFVRFGERSDRVGLREALRRVARVHAPLTAAAVAGVVIGLPLLLAGVLAKAAGFYGDTLQGATLNGPTFELALAFLGFMALGLGAIPAALAFGWFAETLIAPVSRGVHAFATMATVTILAVTLQVAEVSVRFDEGVLQERYLFFLVPLLAVGMCGAVLRSRHPVRITLGGSLLVAALVASIHYQSTRSAFWYQVSPAMTSFYDWIRPAFGGAAGPTANPGASHQIVAALVVLALGVALAVLWRGIRRDRLLAGLGALAIVFCAAETVHSLSSVLNGNSTGKGFGGKSISDADWVDRSVGGAAAAQLVSNVGGLEQSRGLWEESEFWNRQIGAAYTFGGVVDSYLPTTSLTIEQASGAVRIAPGAAAAGQAPAQPDLVMSSRGFPVQLAGSVIGHSPEGNLQVVSLQPPAHAAWAVIGVSSDGWLSLGSPATVMLYELRGLSGSCATVSLTLSLSALTSSPRTLMLSGPGLREAVAFAPGRTSTVPVRVCAQGSAVPRLAMQNLQGPAVSDPEVGLQLMRVSVSAP